MQVFMKIGEEFCRNTNLVINLTKELAQVKVAFVFNGGVLFENLVGNSPFNPQNCSQSVIVKF